MKMSKFEKEYRKEAVSATPILEEISSEKAKTPFTKRPAFKMLTSALSLILVAGIVTLSLHFANKPVNPVVNTEDISIVNNCGSSYDEIDRRFKEAMEDAKQYSYTLKYKANLDDGAITDGAITTDEAVVEEPSKSNDFSSTNLQVEGVDEADIAKTDGSYIYYYSYKIPEKGIQIFDVRDPAHMNTAGSIDVYKNIDNRKYSGAIISEFFLDNNRLTVIFEATTGTTDDFNYEAYYGFCGCNTSYGIAVYDVSDISNTKCIRTYLQEGYYNSSRRIGDYVYLITQKYNYNISSYDGNPEKVIPCYSDSCVGPNADCIPSDKIYFDNSNEISFTIIGAVNVADSEEKANAITFLGNVENVYSSVSAIYTICTSYNDNEESTIINKFNIDRNDIEYKASGKAEGYIINQFAADEYNGYFRVATTRYNEISTVSKSIAYSGQTDNCITIFNDNMETTGSLTGLATGEHIYSVRFTGDTGYVVTFRTVDPLFTFDLSDPTAPKVTGELKIPGYSEYLHPYSENIMIGVGQDAAAFNENDAVAYYEGLKISLFDVSDDFNPTEIDTMIIGDRGTFSAIEHDHKALAYYPSKDVFGIPVELCEIKDKEHSTITDYGDHKGEFFYIFSLNEGKKIEVKAIISQQNEFEYTEIQRGIFIGNNIFTLSHECIQCNEIETGNTIGVIRF